MDKFLEFLGESQTISKNLNTVNDVHVVFGNESCDMDSTVSSLCLAYLIHQKSTNTPVIPIMNVSKKHFCLRTETCYVLQQHGISLDYLIFKDQINMKELLKCKNLRVSLVDHHVLSSEDKIFEPYVVEIFDHRPINSRDICKSDRQVIQPVGSCATLITKEIVDVNPGMLFNDLCEILYATIIYDTIGLEEGCGKTTSEDIAMVERLEKILRKTPNHRKYFFDQLNKVHNDTSGIQTVELLYRDLKIVKNVPMPGLPLLVEDYLKRHDAAAALDAFADEFRSPAVVLIGIDAKQEVKRDVGIYYRDADLKNALVKLLRERKDSKGNNLCLREVACDVPNTVCFRQCNIKLTRKFILPLVDEVVLKYNL